MSVVYDKFLRLGGMQAPELPKTYPYTITMLMDDGTFKEQTIRQNSDLDLRKPISVKIHAPNALDVLTQEVCNHMEFTNVKTVSKVGRMLEYLQGRGLLKVDGEPSGPDWLETKLDSLGIRFTSSRKAVRDWFEHPDQNPTCDDVLGSNQILTVKPSGGGRVIVLPTGHTIAYTTAKTIYSHMKGIPTFTDLPIRPSVGEYVGRGNFRHNSNHRLVIDHGSVSVGCQRVSRDAIDDLAKREGWSK